MATQDRDPVTLHSSDRRRSQRLSLRISVFVQGRSREGKTMEEVGYTLSVNAHGALIELSFEPEETRYLVLHNRITNHRQACRLVWSRQHTDGKWHCGVEFVVPSPHFWGVEFPPEDWGAN